MFPEAEFVTSQKVITEKLSKIKAFFFDWDGVFNKGEKGVGLSSSFSEVDSMGTNLLRFGHWLKNASLPITGIITGMQNETAVMFAQREHFDGIFFKIKNKVEVLEHLENEFNIKPHEVAFIFDDALDLSLAKKCGLRFFINRKSNPFFTDYVKRNELCDYVTANTTGNFPVREISEVILTLYNIFDEVIDRRTDYDEKYKAYIAERNARKTKIFTKDKDKIIEIGANPIGFK